MYSGKQALRLEKFKASDIGGLDKELKERKGSGKYDSNRTPYNIELINYDDSTLASSTYDYLYSNNINYNPNKKSTKVLNGLIISSGQEFFEHYGMEFKDTGEVYKTGDNAGKPIRHVIIDENHGLPNEIKEEKDVYTFEEFQKYITGTTSLNDKTMFEMLYYCGLRCGEARGLQWSDIDWNNKLISITKQANNVKDSQKYYELTPPKTSKSIRTLPLTDVLYNDLVDLYNEKKKYYGFNDKWFIFDFRYDV